MYVTSTNTSGFSVKAWQGDAKTLLAFNFSSKQSVRNLAGFSIQVQPHGHASYYLFNQLALSGTGHAVVSGEPINSSANHPIQKFRWLHVPGAFHQGDNVFYGVYKYTITPRYFNDKILTEIDTSLSVSVEIVVQPFATKQIELGFTRGFTQSQAFIHHFGSKVVFRPTGKDLLFDTSGIAGKNNAGQSYTFEQEYAWSGFTARQKIFALLNDVTADSSLFLDVFAYDLNEPDILKIFLQLAKEGRIRIILDNASLHHSPTAPEDAFEKEFRKVMAGQSDIKRGKFGRFAHDKVFIVYKNNKAIKALSGSTNFSITGIYVNSNHVIVFNNHDVAELYAKVFEEAWDKNVSIQFNHSSLSEQSFVFNQKGLPSLSITFSPHQESEAEQILDAIKDRIVGATSNVLFAVMDIKSGSGPVLPALQNIHANQEIFSYGISDSPDGIFLYKPGSKEGELVGGKPGGVVLPPPFEKEHTIGLGHQIHHKFVICDFGTERATVWCGSSNLALGGEKENGDNLIQIQDDDIVTVFTLEAIALVDHFDFRNKHTKPKKELAPKAIKGEHQETTEQTTELSTANSNNDTITLYDNDSWAERYFDPNDLHYKDRTLFG